MKFFKNCPPPPFPQKKKPTFLTSSLQNTKLIHVLQFRSSLLALIYRSRWWRHNVSKPLKPSDKALHPKDTNPWHHTQLPIMLSYVPYSNRGSPTHDCRVGLFSGACRWCLLSVIMHAVVFDAFFQGTYRDWLQPASCSETSWVCCGRAVTFVLMEISKHLCLCTRILASSCACGSEPTDSIGGRQAVDKQTVGYKVGLSCLTSVIQTYE